MEHETDIYNVYSIWEGMEDDFHSTNEIDKAIELFNRLVANAIPGMTIHLYDTALNSLVMEDYKE